MWSLEAPCNNTGCYCDIDCHHLGDCCSDIAEIRCHPVNFSSPTSSPTDTFGKTKREAYTIN